MTKKLSVDALSSALVCSALVLEKLCKLCVKRYLVGKNRRVTSPKFHSRQDEESLVSNQDDAPSIQSIHSTPPKKEMFIAVSVVRILIILAFWFCILFHGHYESTVARSLVALVINWMIDNVLLKNDSNSSICKFIDSICNASLSKYD
jgi:hypothetical protein